MVGKYKSYWDGKNEKTITKIETFICDACKKQHEYFVTAGFAIPPAGIIINDGEIFICDECVLRYVNVNYDILNMLIYYKKTNSENFSEELFNSVEYFLPQIFKMKRRALPTHLKTKILKKYNYKCVHCGSKDNLTIDHIKPYIKGGEDKEKNLQVLCRSCNSKKGTK